MRLSKDYKNFEESVDLLVHTKCPEKWLLIDKETGQIYQGNNGGYWDRLDPVIKDEYLY
jgi:hypothetical protein